MGVFSTWKNKDPTPKHLFSRTNPTNKGIYNDKGELLCDQVKRFKWIHYFLKYKVVVPCIRLFVRMFKKKLITEIPDRPQLEYLKLFNEAYEEAFVDWNNIFLCSRNDKHPKIKEHIDGQILKDLKNIMNTIVAYDTAYIELLHFMMTKIAQKMNKHYKTHDNKHLLYTSFGVEDVHYFALFPNIDGVKKKELKEVGVTK